MSLRFFQRVNLLPGLTLNFSKSGLSLSMGPRGARFTVGGRGTRATLGLPGTGLFYSVHRPWRKAAAQPGQGGRSQKTTAPSAQEQSKMDEQALLQAKRKAARKQLELNRLQRWWLPPEQVALRDALLALHEGQEALALQHLATALPALQTQPQAHWLAGVLCFGQAQDERAREHFERALALWTPAHTEAWPKEAGLDATITVTVPLAPWVQAHLRPSLSSARLMLAEVAQRQGELPQMLEHLLEVVNVRPDDVVVHAAYLEALVESVEQHWQPDSAQDALPEDARAVLGEAVQRSAWIGSSGLVEAVARHYRAKALQLLGLPEAARELWGAELRKSARLPLELVCAMRYSRALSYEAAGHRARARQELQKVYAVAPGHADVASRLGLR